MNATAVPSASSVLGRCAAVALALACAPAAAATKDACKLLSSAEIAAIVGVDLGAGEYTIPGSRELCTWTRSPKPAQGPTALQISFMPPSDFKEMKSMASSMPKGMFVAVPGVGDDAFYTTMGDSTSIRVRKGNTAFEVGVPYRADTPAEAVRNSQALAKALAAKLVTKL